MSTMTVSLSKTASVLTQVESDSTWVSFEIERDEPDETRRRDVTIDYATWQDLGEPETITVTIEPGDRLNEETPA
jgi:hypothetical protein